MPQHGESTRDKSSGPSTLTSNRSPKLDYFNLFRRSPLISFSCENLFTLQVVNVRLNSSSAILIAFGHPDTSGAICRRYQIIL